MSDMEEVVNVNSLVVNRGRRETAMVKSLVNVETRKSESIENNSKIFYRNEEVSSSNDNICEKLRIMFWNAAGIVNKNRSFWELLKGYDVLLISESWIGENDVVKIDGRLNKNYNWKIIFAEKVMRKGRAKGGILIGIRKVLDSKINNEWKWGAEIEVKCGRNLWKIIFVYVRENRMEISETIGEIAENEPDDKVLIVGDFNARIGEEIGAEVEDENVKERVTRDKIMNVESQREKNI